MAHPRLRRVALGVLVANAVLQLLDLLTTFVAHLRGGVEANPMAAFVLDAGGWPAFIALKLLLASLFVVALPFVHRAEPTEHRATTHVAGGLAAWMTVVVLHNAVFAGLA